VFFDFACHHSSMAPRDGICLPLSSAEAERLITMRESVERLRPTAATGLRVVRRDQRLQPSLRHGPVHLRQKHLPVAQSGENTWTKSWSWAKRIFAESSAPIPITIIALVVPTKNLIQTVNGLRVG